MTSYRIISKDASELAKNKYDIVVKKEDYRSFNNSFDDSLDNRYLYKIMSEKDKKNFLFEDDIGNEYSLVIVNVSFDKIYKDKDDSRNTIHKKELRENLYKNGFILNGNKYVRYKRSCGSSREGNCLFVLEKYNKKMTSWSDDWLGKVKKNPLASWESYRALSLSSIESTIEIPVEGIVFVDDIESTFKDNCVVVEHKEGRIVATEKEVEIKNKIWDGEALLDDSLFTKSYAEKSMLLLRNKFFKSCGFRTNLQKFFSDNNIKEISDLNPCCITFAGKIKDIKMVVTTSSLKFLKFMNGGFNRENVKKWLDNISPIYGIVKHDKKTPYFNGRMVQTSYQFLNTLGMSKNDVEKLLNDSKNYCESVWKHGNIAELRYHLHNAVVRDILVMDYKDEGKIGEEEILSRSDIILKILEKNTDIVLTDYYTEFKNQAVKDFKENIRKGHILIDGTYATLFGNGPELLKYLLNDSTKESILKSPIMRENTIFSKAFNNREEIVGARSPHITMGNLLFRTNDIDNPFINEYFSKLTNEIVCVNAINENIQNMLNGCDYDSDSILLTNNKLILKTVEKQSHFLVPYSAIKEVDDKDEKMDLCDLDYISSNNYVGEIVNKSQLLNSLYWDYSNKNSEENLEIYYDACKYAIFSGVEIDSAKKNFEIKYSDIRDKLNKSRKTDMWPVFFKDVYGEKEKRKINEEIKDDERSKKEIKEEYEKVHYIEYETCMDYVYATSESIDLRKNKPKNKEKKELTNLFSFDSINNSNSYKEKAERCLSILKESAKKILNYIRFANYTKDEGERKIAFKNAKQEKDRCCNAIMKMVEYQNTFRILLDRISNEDNKFLMYDILFNIDCVINSLNEKAPTEKLTEDVNGDIQLYSLKFSKK